MIYKYIDLAGLRFILSDNTLKFTKPENFNDPFEFHENLVNKKITFKHWIQIVKAKEPNVTKERLNQHIQTFRDNYGEFCDGLKDQFLKRKQTTGVCCFSEIFNSQLMWAHYADQHKGACIGFSREILFSDFNGDCDVDNVKYVKEIRSISLSKYRDKAILHWIMTKGKVWEYEKEIRIVLGSNPSEFVKFNSSAIKQVIFGCKMDDSEKESIDELIFSTKKFDWIETSEMKVSDKKFRLEKNKRR